MIRGRPFVIVGALLVVTAGVALFLLKHAIEAREMLVAEIHQQYLEDQAAVRVMRAEWAYLNSPDYLQSLVQKHLALGPARPAQIIESVSAIPLRNGRFVSSTFRSTVKHPPEPTGSRRSSVVSEQLTGLDTLLHAATESERD